MNNDRILVDEIVFLAGLASNLSAINPLLNTVRVITASQEVGKPLALTSAERRSLESVHAQIKEYLLHKDSVRTFTKEELQQTIESQFHPSESGQISPRRRVHNQFQLIIKIIGATYVVTAAAFLLFSVPYWWLLAASCTVTTMFISSCWLFLTGYKTFTPALRKAYAWMCAGVVLLGISASCWMLFTSIPKVHAVPILHYGLVYWLFGISFIITYLGVRFFAKAQDVRSPLVSMTWVLAGTLALYAATIFLPHMHTSEDRFLGTTMVGITSISYFGYIIALLANSIRKTLTPAYARAIAWFGRGYALSAIVGLGGSALLLLTGTGFGIKLVIMGMLYATGGMLVFFSGYLFRLSSAGQAEIKETTLAPTAATVPPTAAIRS